MAFTLSQINSFHISKTSKCQNNLDGEKPGKIFPIDTLLVLEGSAEKGKCVSLSATHRGLGVIHY